MIFIGPNLHPVTGQSFSFHESYNGYDAISKKILLYPSKSDNYFLFRTIYFCFKLIKLMILRADNVYLTNSRSYGGFFRDLMIFGICRMFNQNIIIHLHGSDFKDFYDNSPRPLRSLIHFLYSRISDAIILLDGMSNQFVDFPNLDFHVLANFHSLNIDKNELDKKIKKFECSSVIKCLFFSNIIQSKGVFDAIKGVTLARQNGVDVRLDIAGSFIGSTSEVNHMSLMLDDAIKELDYVNFLGPLYDNEKQDIFIESDVLLFPTYYPPEAQPITILEGFAAGNLIFFTDHNYLCDFLSNKNGELINIQDPYSISKKLHDVSLNRAHYAEIMNSNFSHVSTQYTKSAYLRRFNGILKDFSNKGLS